MESKILDNTKGELVIRFDYFDQGMLNLIKDELWIDSATEMAGFKVTHPEVGFARFVLRTKGKAAVLVWNSALKRAANNIESFGKSLALQK
jgi:DNA-directed RNA polymerase subunit L